MTAALVLIVLVSRAEVQSPASLALQHAAEEVLGGAAQVTVEAYETPPEDSELTDKSHSADLVAELTWQDTRHRRALVHCYITKLHRFVNRELTFEDQDELGERGRLIGFALASMAPEQKRASPEPAPVQATSAAPAADTRARSAAPGTPAREGPRVGAVDAMLLGAVGLGGPASGFGAGIAGRWFFARAFSLRLGTGVRHGDAEVAQSVSELFFGGVGLGFQFSNFDSPSPFSLGGRTDLLLISHTLRRRSPDDSAPEHQSRVMGGADLLLEGSWYFWKHAGLFANSGGELSFGHTDVLVGGKEVADIPALRLVSELGIRANF